MDKVSIALQLMILHQQEKWSKLNKLIRKTDGAREIYLDVLEIIKTSDGEEYDG